ncbi:hypothetical protein Si002_01438 [Streptococcus infantarius subsp. infantarius]|nr:hypothetical protein [Streptococcus infantarius subsp. infantarius]MCO4691455.1 hypothetical protein [Streptococcus infantarius subsp. infantarius]
MNIPLPLTWDEQLELFKERGMVVKADDVKKLEHISYYRLKEFARPLATTRRENGQTIICYNDISFSQVLTRYYQDKNLRINLLHAIEKIEVSLKTKVSYILGKKYGAFGYLNFSNWVNRNRFNRFETEKKQYYFKKNLMDIISRSNNPELHRRDNLSEDGFPSVWLGIDLLMFGNLVSLIELMNSKILKELAALYDFKVKELLSWIKCLNFIRNLCAHNSNILDVKLKTAPVNRESWNKFLYIIHRGDSERPTNRFAIVLLIVIEFVRKINDSYRWNNIKGNLNAIRNSSDKNVQLLGFKDNNTTLNPNKIIDYFEEQEVLSKKK